MGRKELLGFTNGRFPGVESGYDIYRQSAQIPEVFQGRNVLRYELRFTSRLKRQFGSEIKALDLYNENFYIEIVNRWQNAYFEIRKLNRFKMDSIKIENVKGLLNQLALIGLEAVGGEQAVLEMLENERESGTLDRFQFKRFKDKLSTLTTNEKYFEPNDCILELDRKVSQAAKYYR